MATQQLACFLRHLRTLAGVRTAGDLTDGQLLERFCSRREETAFALLVQRHGPMVLSVCRRTLGNAADAEDAFQATFLVLARRGASIRRRESVGSWLYGVASQIALKARAQAARRRSSEARATARTAAGPLAELTRQELRAVLDEEPARLPERYRAPVVLCDLEGKTHEQAARELGCPKSSLSSRLVRARGLLRQRLVRRGIAVSAGLVAVALAEGASPAAVPALLTITTVQHALPAGSGRAVTADGRILASGGVDGTIQLWDLVTGRERRTFHGHSPGGEGRFSFAAGVSALAFSDDGTTLVSGGGDTTVLLWDLTGSAPEGRPGTARPTPQQLDALWDGLSSADAGKADEAAWALAAAPEEAVPLLAEHVRPVSPADPRRIARFVSRLDRDRFEERSEATRALDQFGEHGLRALRQALARSPSPETRRRLGELLDRLDHPDSSQRLRQLRAVEVLEHAGTPEARALLQRLTGGVPEARLTQEAKASLERLARRAGRRASPPPHP